MTDGAVSDPSGAALSKRSAGFSIFLSVLLIACGFLAILLPIEMSFGVVIVLSWLLIFTGAVQFIHVFRCKGVGHGIWKALIAIIYLATGIYLRLNPEIGIATLTLALIAFFVTQGLVDIFIYFRTRKARISRWLLLDGVVTLLLGLMIWRHWPSGSLGIIGLLVGVNMMFTGITRLMLTMAVRRWRLGTEEVTPAAAA
jgi:uncharacterized membrane protein HdeD (DUF308 family)